MQRSRQATTTRSASTDLPCGLGRADEPEGARWPMQQPPRDRAHSLTLENERFDHCRQRRVTGDHRTTSPDRFRRPSTPPRPTHQLDREEGTDTSRVRRPGYPGRSCGGADQHQREEWDHRVR
eukprot:4359566-Pyramimonas_sp.AAC.1